MPAKLIAIEGLDGSGKQTQTALLREALKARGLKVKSVAFPRYGEPSAELVEDYLRGGFGEHAGDVNAYAASSFFAMDRLVSYLKGWRTDYEACDVLVADRYTTSNVIHQCSKLPRSKWGAFCDWLMDYEFDLLGLPRPDVVVYLHMEVETSQRLLERRYGGDPSKRDVHERDLAYLRRSQEAAEWCCKRLGWILVECVDEGELRDRVDVHEDLLAGIGFAGYAERETLNKDQKEQKEL